MRLECPSCRKPLTVAAGTTVTSEEAATLPPKPVPSALPKPTGAELPPWLAIVDLALAAVVILLSWCVLRADWATNSADEVRAQWKREIARELLDPLAQARIERAVALPARGDAVIFVDEPDDARLVDELMAATSFVAHSKRVLREPDVNTEPLPHDASFVAAIDHLAFATRIRVLIFSTRPYGGPLRDPSGGLWQGANLFAGPGERPSFRFDEHVFRLTSLGALALLLIAVAGSATRRVLLQRHRRHLVAQWEESEKGRTAGIYAAKEHLDAAREHAAKNVAKALVELKLALALVPDYDEARALQRLLSSSQSVDSAAITQTARSATSGAAATTLYLRVVGTPYAYRADASADVIRIGRQRSQVGESDGNDLVIRVPASDRRSLRISRRHFEVDRIARDYFVIDRSGGRTLLNGQALKPDEPTQIATGDRLTVAEVLTLEVSLRGMPFGEGGAKVMDAGDDRLRLEATVGDMLTEVHDG